MKTLLKGGTVVSAAGSRIADVLVDGEKIAAVGEGLLCSPRDSCDTGADAVMPPIAAGAAGFLLCRSEEAAETGEACVPVCGIGFSALPLCAGIGRCEARCSAGRAASDRAVERGGVPVSRLEDGGAGDTSVVGA